MKTEKIYIKQIEGLDDSEAQEQSKVLTRDKMSRIQLVINCDLFGKSE